MPHPARRLANSHLPASTLIFDRTVQGLLSSQLCDFWARLAITYCADLRILFRTVAAPGLAAGRQA